MHFDQIGQDHLGLIDFNGLPGAMEAKLTVQGRLIYDWKNLKLPPFPGCATKDGGTSSDWDHYQDCLL